MPDEQDRAEALDEDKAPSPADHAAVVDLLDQTADVDPGQGDIGAAVIDQDETGDDLDGVRADLDDDGDPFHAEVPAPEVAAMHVIDEATP